MADSILPISDDVDLLLARAIWPDASVEDIDALQVWIGDNAERALLVAQMRLVYRTLPVQGPLHRTDAAWNRIRFRLGLTPRVSEVPLPEQRRTMRPTLKGMHLFDMQALSRGRWYVLFGVTVGLVMFLVGRGTSRSTRMLAPMTVYATRNGERADVTLPDGSHVFLNVASRLEVPTDFAAGNRGVRLKGEALFTVVHRRGGAFTVATAGTTTRVLGTSFVVRHYSTDSTVRVAVRDGRVALQSVAIAAHQQAEVGPKGGIRVHRVDSAEFAFEGGRLVLNWVSLADAIVELNRWYDADIRLGTPALATRYLHASFAEGSLGDLSAILAYTLDLRVVRAGRTLTLYAK